jgi:hypothetical protein
MAYHSQSSPAEALNSLHYCGKTFAITLEVNHDFQLPFYPQTERKIE